jgi:hypothetical protein
MSSVNAQNNRIDLTVRVFDSFNRFALEVPTDEYDVVNSFFQSIFGRGDAAAAFTSNLFQISQATSTPVLSLLDQIQGLDSMQLTATMAYYLNGVRSPATLLGVNTVVTPNVWAARNVIQ